MLKVDYFRSKYESLREGIHLHAVRVDSLATFREFLLDLAIDYAFVCIDQLTKGDSPRQDVVYRALNEAAVPFIDSGVSLSVEESVVRGSVTTGAYDAGSVAWKDAIPNARVEGNVPGLSQRPAAGSKRVGGGACRDGVAAAYRAICFEV